MPPGEVFLRSAHVEHQASGISVIDAGDLDGETLYDRFHLAPGSGLTGTLHAGQALGGETWRYRAHSSLLAFGADTTSFVWLLTTGKPSVTTDSESPEVGALLLWEVTTDASTIIATLDRRTYTSASRVITLGGDLPASPGFIDRLTVVDERLFIERVVVDVPGLGGGTSGETVFDLFVNGATIYTSSSTDDQRPRFAFDAPELTHWDGVPEVLELRRGDEIRLETAQHAVGGVPARYECRWLGGLVPHLPASPAPTRHGPRYFGAILSDDFSSTARCLTISTDDSSRFA